MEPKLVQIARSRIEKKEIRLLKEHSKQITKNLVELNGILEDFKETFRDYLPLLDEAGIEYNAYFNDNRYPGLYGSYIEFKRTVPSVDARDIVEGGKNTITLRMDFDHGKSYRYEHVVRGSSTRKVGRSVYGEWPKEDIVMFLYGGLFAREYNSEDILVPNYL